MFESRRGCSKGEKDVLKQKRTFLNRKRCSKQKNDVLKQEICSFFEIFKIHFVPGRPGTEEFVPGHLLLTLSRDKGTPGQTKLFCPGTKGQQDRETFLSRDKGTTERTVPVCSALSQDVLRDVPSLGNPSLSSLKTKC